MRYYVFCSNRNEFEVIGNIHNRMNRWFDYIEEILIPTNDVFIASKESMKHKSKKFSPYLMLRFTNKVNSAKSFASSLTRYGLSYCGVENIEPKNITVIKSTTPNESFNIGDRVKVVDGAFLDFCGNVKCVTGNTLIISVSIMGNQDEIELSINDVEIYTGEKEC